MKTKALVGVFMIVGLAAIFTVVALNQHSSSTVLLSSSSQNDWEIEKDFINYIAQYRKNYFNREEYDARFQLFKVRKAFVEESNANPDHTFTLGINHLADLFDHEYRANFNGFKGVNSNHGANGYTVFRANDLPDSVDWNADGKVSSVKNQGMCGSCWSFSATQAIESCAAIADNTSPVDLSEQQMVDCSTSYGNQGCNGGLMDSAFKYVVEKGGLDTAAQYPYTGKDDSCNTKSPFKASITGYSDITPESESQLMAAVATQPVSVAVDAAGLSWQLYLGGIVNNKWLCGTSLDHGVLLVGYGHDSGKNLDYWLVKNSWGASWGIKGYIKIARNGDGKGMCGIQQQNSIPTGCHYA